ncbi:Ku protein [Streptomyces sp. MS1.HAVA.3]|uniref:Ku protein n=1 Tax=Streptomyces caledonius TaxID=3134107 RepID=A0ABU8TZJ9_9ACTN
MAGHREPLPVAFRQIHVADNGFVKVKKVCELDGVEVSAAEIGRGYETATGIVEITDAVLSDKFREVNAMAAPRRSRSYPRSS